MTIGVRTTAQEWGRVFETSNGPAIAKMLNRFHDQPLRLHPPAANIIEALTESLLKTLDIRCRNITLLSMRGVMLDPDRYYGFKITQPFGAMILDWADLCHRAKKRRGLIAKITTGAKLLTTRLVRPALTELYRSFPTNGRLPRSVIEAMQESINALVLNTVVLRGIGDWEDAEILNLWVDYLFAGNFPVGTTMSDDFCIVTL